MPTSYLQNLGKAVLGKNITQKITNLFNQALFTFFGNNFTSYDPKGPVYVDKGYNLNSVVYSVVNMAATKVSSVPTFLKKVESKQAKAQLERLLQTKGVLPAGELAKKRILETNAYNQGEIPEPLERPNYYQTWTEFYALWQTGMMLNGNAYIYMLYPSDGPNKGVPKQVFLLPSQYMEIIIRDGAFKDEEGNINDDQYLSLDNPIDHYIMNFGNSYIQFPRECIIHSKYPNPNYDLNGSHLYGQSPLKAALKNLNINNSATEQNIKAMQNGGVFGFVHGTDAKEPLTSEQALALKQSLVEMERDTTVLSRYKGASVPIGFTKLSLNTDELKPFEFLRYSAQEICNVYAWPSGFFGVNGEPKYDNADIQWRMAISNRIQPDLTILAQDLNSQFYPRFKNMQGVVKVWDVSELPEMQTDMATLTGWLKEAMDRGVITPEEYRIALKYPETGEEYMQKHYIKTGYEPLEDISLVLEDDEPLKL